MTDHDADVAAVLDEAECVHRGNLWNGGCYQTKEGTHPECTLAALAAAGYAVVKMPEGAEVEHGARLVKLQGGTWVQFYAIEDTP